MSKLEKYAAAGVLATIAFTVVMIVQLRAQQTVTGDFRNAQSAEVRDAQGTVLLKGTFAPADGGDDQEVERLAKLTPAAVGGSGAGEAEVEYRTDTPNVQEVEFQVEGLAAGAAVTLFLDGKPVLKATVDGKGRAEAEANVSVASPSSN